MHDAPIVRFVDAMIQSALDKGASDIHLEPHKDQVKIRFRIDGHLADQQVVEQQFKDTLIARIKVLAHIDIAEKRIAQDGKFRKERYHSHVDFRVSAFPTIHGQKIVIRILDQSKQSIRLEQVGLSVPMRTQLEQMLKVPQGFILVSGPTGSGKTTTLYAALSLLNDTRKHIITLEDPVEYTIQGITQGQVNHEIGFDFARGLRALLRQDPDIVMVGEIRDRETARIAIESSLTGHLVLSTIHTNDAPSVVLRLLDMGIEPYLVTAALTGVVAQRLIRTLCNRCKRFRSVTENERAVFERGAIAVDQIAEPVGCAACHQKGFKGRTALFQLMSVTPTLKRSIVGNPVIEDIYRQAVSEGMTSLMRDGLEKVAQGLISFDELLAVAAHPEQLDFTPV